MTTIIRTNDSNPLFGLTGNGIELNRGTVSKLKIDDDIVQSAILSGSQVAAPLPVASISTQANYLRNGYWNWFGSSSSPRSFNLTTTGVGSQTVNRELIYDYDGFSSIAGAGTDSNGLTGFRRILVDRVLQDISSKFGITFRRATITDPIENVDIFFMDNDLGAYSNVELFGSGNLVFGTNHRYVDYGWVNVAADWNDGSNAANDYTYQTFYHEILHVLGLGHAGAYNGNAIYITDSTAATTNNNVFLNDSWEMSIMSYIDQEENTTVPGSTTNFLINMMAADVAALRTYYGGAAFTGNTIYGVGTNILPSANEMLANLSTFAGTNAFCIVDDGGIDTVNFSNFNVNQRLDLSVRSAADASNYGNTTSDIGGRLRNMTLAAGTVIENAVLGGGNDTIIGNEANNSLDGGAGNDTLYGGGGNDSIDGGTGNDLVYLGDGDDYVNIPYESRGDDTFYGGNGNDFIWGGYGNEVVYGDAGDDTLKGYYGNDTLYGGAGNDYLGGEAGNDSLYGGAGNNTLNGYGNTDAEVDTLYGGRMGRDDFILGGNWGVSYLGSGYAIIVDWEWELDSIEVQGSASDYSLSFGSFGVGSQFELDTGIYRTTNNSLDLIAVVQDSTNVQIPWDFKFV